MSRPGRNDPCPCGSGKKYKRCCLPRESAAGVANPARLRQMVGALVEALVPHAASHFPDTLPAAWQAFSGQAELPRSPAEQVEFDALFLPWYLFQWRPRDTAPAGETPPHADLTVARHYGQTHGRQLDDRVHRLIEAGALAPHGFWEVVGSAGERGLTLLDLFTRHRCTVYEPQAARHILRGEILFARVIRLDHVSLLLGCSPRPLDPALRDRLLAERERLTARHGPLDAERLRALDKELRGLYRELARTWVPRAPG